MGSTCLWPHLSRTFQVRVNHLKEKQLYLPPSWSILCLRRSRMCFYDHINSNKLNLETQDQKTEAQSGQAQLPSDWSFLIRSAISLDALGHCSQANHKPIVKDFKRSFKTFRLWVIESTSWLVQTCPYGLSSYNMVQLQRCVTIS